MNSREPPTLQVKLFLLFVADGLPVWTTRRENTRATSHQKRKYTTTLCGGLARERHDEDSGTSHQIQKDGSNAIK